jgi:L-2-hydroxyglutarate oxidase LhgO
MDHVESCVIGAGVVGLAIAARLAARSDSLILLDAESNSGQGISSRNSEVIHAGIYYPKDSLKARLCREGKHTLYEYCDRHGVSCKRTGKLIVATQADETDTLVSIQQQATANGIDDLEFWTHDRIARQEPHVRAVEALFSPSTGIVSCHELMTAYLAEAESHGAVFAPLSKVIRLQQKGSEFVVESLIDNSQTYQFSCRYLVNAAGLGAQRVAHLLDHGMAGLIPELFLCKGNYFSLPGTSPFSHLIYPVPEASGAGLGVHATLDLGGQVKFGPDVEYVYEENYAVSENRLPAYYEAIRRYYPDLADDTLVPAYAGIRPKIQAQDAPVRDFEIQGEAIHGVANMVRLFGIESPGLTASAAIGSYVVDMLAGRQSLF